MDFGESPSVLKNTTPGSCDVGGSGVGMAFRVDAGPPPSPSSSDLSGTEGHEPLEVLPRGAHERLCVHLLEPP